MSSYLYPTLRALSLIVNMKLRKEGGLAVNSSPNIFYFYTWKENEVRNGKCHVNVNYSHKKRLSIKCIL